MCAQPMRCVASLLLTIARHHASWCSLRGPALDAREPSLAALARQRSLYAGHCSLRALASARSCEPSLAARGIDAGRSTRGTRACARCARGYARFARGRARCGAARLLPTRDCCALLFPSPIRPLLTAHDTRQGCCLVLVHHGLAHCIRAAWATSSLARRHMPALYNTP